MQISIVIPVYNGAASIDALVTRLIDVLGTNALQIVLVNDGSPDKSDEICRSLYRRFSETITYVKLAKNFGEHNAVMAGLQHARGDYVVIMDDDFQNPPDEVVRLIEHACGHNYDIVYTFYRHKRHHWFRNLGSLLNDRVANFMLDKPRDLYLSSFKCLSRFTVDEILKYRGPFPYLDGLALRCTRNIGKLEVCHQPRREGRSNYTFRRLVRLWLNMFVNFSVMPLRLSTLMGLAFGAAGFLMGAWVFVEKMTFPDVPVGWPSVIVAIVLFSGVQLVMLGLLGEYLGRLFLSSNQTPQYVVREVLDGELESHLNAPHTAIALAGPANRGRTAHLR
ncbi:MAG TPA: glycosyltransferase family 2 protein [Gemmataceae bacterium]|nr:glycosyltransferase family 2 protein [Gemmataceae bacterium]